MLDLTGQRFDRLTVISELPRRRFPSGQLQRHWRCQCVCGKITEVAQQSLRSGVTQSCGCLGIERVKERFTTHGHTVNGVMSSTYKAWINMKNRCENPRVMSYANYGGRGIEVCPAWHDFRSFLADMGERPKGLTLERLDNDGNYEPGNCRWGTRKAQARNRRNNHLLTLNDETHCLAEWAEITGLDYHVIYNRLVIGWPVKRALTEPVHVYGERKR